MSSSGAREAVLPVEDVARPRAGTDDLHAASVVPGRLHSSPVSAPRPVLGGHPGLVHGRFRCSRRRPRRAPGTRSAAASTPSSSHPPAPGKTLAAFLWSLDRLAAAPPPADEQRRCRVLYVSPLKALAVDVERNLRAPLTGIGQAAARLGPSARRSGSPSAPATPRPTSAGAFTRRPTGHPHHHAGVAVPAADQFCPGGIAWHRDGDRRRGARRPPHQAWRPSRGVPRPARRVARPSGPADRPVRDGPPDRGGRDLSSGRAAGADRGAAVGRRSGTSRSSSRSRT